MGRVVRGVVLWGKSDLPDQAPPNTVEEQDPNDQTVLRALEYLLASRILNPHKRERLPSPQPRQSSSGKQRRDTAKSPHRQKAELCRLGDAVGTKLQGQGEPCTPLAAHRW